jgi:3-hydroxyacyl-CoA dehydrogenase
MGVKKIFIIGSGTMGSGLAQTAIAAGYETVLRSRNAGPEVVEKNRAKLTKSLCEAGGKR